MDAASRAEHFNEEDHVRCFGTEDFADRVLSLFDEDFDRVDLASRLGEADLSSTCIPPPVLRSLNGHSAFLFVKRG